MSRKATYLIAGAIFVAAAVLGLSRQSFFAGSPAQAQASETYRQLNLFGEIFERILADYVDEVDEATLIQAAIAGMVQSLDPHSSYLVPDAFMDMQFTTRGEFGGLGIEVTQENGVVTVVSPIDDTPAARAGIMAGDRIVGIDGESIEGMSLNEAVAQCHTEHPTWPDMYLRPWTQAKQQLDLTFLATENNSIGDWQAVMCAIQCPTLLVTADPAAGGIVTPQGAAEICAMNPHFQLAHFPGIGHHVRFAVHEAYMVKVREFLAENK